MPVLCDFIQIVGDSSQTIDPVAGAGEVPVPANGTAFNTGGRRNDATALLTVSARNLTGSAQVFINGNLVGSVTATSGAFWSTQLVAVAGSQLHDGDNHMVLKNVSDQFQIKDVICFFHQAA